MIRNVLRSLGLPSRPAVPVRRPEVQADFPALRTTKTLAIIGDVHGMIRPLARLLERLERQDDPAAVICVGDLIDRGDHSADVLRLAYDRRERMVVLMGNHEEMMLRFLDDPQAEADRWLRYGGMQTLASFGIAPPASTANATEFARVRDRLRAALGDEIERWLRALPRTYVHENLAVTHAGADPWLPIDLQADHHLTWGHPDFARRQRADGIWVAHGHVIVDAPRAEGGVISVDTGAYAGGPLTAAEITDGTVRFHHEGP